MKLLLDTALSHHSFICKIMLTKKTITSRGDIEYSTIKFNKNKKAVVVYWR